VAALGTVDSIDNLESNHDAILARER